MAVAIITTLDDGRPHRCTGMVGRVTWASAAGEGRPVIHDDGRLRELRETDE